MAAAEAVAYTAVARASVRQDKELTSRKIGEILSGEVVVAVERAELPDSTVRVRIHGGWMTRTKANVRR